MRSISALLLALLWFTCGSCFGADFDGDGVADNFSVTRNALTSAADSSIRWVNPWKQRGSPKGVGLIVHLSRKPQSFLLHDPSFFASPMWNSGGKLPVAVITTKDPRYREWKRQVPQLQWDAIQLGTEASIDILLYWTGRQWTLFWPKEQP